MLYKTGTGTWTLPIGAFDLWNPPTIVVKNGRIALETRADESGHVFLDGLYDVRETSCDPPSFLSWTRFRRSRHGGRPS